MDYAALKNLPLLFFEQAEKFGSRPFLWRKHDDVWRAMAWSEVAERTTALARGLRSLGITRGDRVALVAENRPEWLMADVAIMATGAITVPAYTTNTVEDNRHILSDSGSKAVILSTGALAANVLPAAAQCSHVETIVSMDPIDAPSNGLRCLAWEEVMEAGRSAEKDLGPTLDGIARDDACCIIYTSGTSGKPKGVVLSHGAILFNCMGAYDFLQHLPRFDEECEIFLSFLPLSHSYEHTAGQFFPISIGAQIYYAEGIDKLTANISEVRPTIMTAVPRLYEAMHGRIRRGVERTGGLKAWMFEKAVKLGRKEYEAPGSLSFGENLLNNLLDGLVRKKVHERFGGRLKAFVSGGAPLNYDIGVFFTALGLNILQGYGQTEAAPVVSCNPVQKNKMRTVGPPLKDVDVKIAEDGEILVRGELVMQGYWNNAEATAETIRDGWLHTGDIGRLDEDSYIEVTDRKKDIIVNSGGDNLSPARVEGMLTAQPEFAQAMVYGDKRPHLVALVVPDPEFLKRWSQSNNRPTDLSAISEDKSLVKALQGAIDRVNEKLSVIERVRRLMVAPEPFTIDNEMMTPTMKLRRHVIKDRYRDALEQLYGR